MLNKIVAIAIFLSILSNARAGNWTSYTNTDNVNQLVSSGNRIWAATSGGVVAYDNISGEITKFTNIEGLKGINYNCAEIDTSGSLWFGTANGWLTKISPAGIIENHAFRDSIGLTGRAIALFDLATDRDFLWVASDIGVSKFAPYSNGGEIKDNARHLGNIQIEEDAVCINVIGDNLWAGTARGVAFIDKDNPNIQFYGNWHSFLTGQNGLANGDIISIASYFDTVLVGTDGGGIFKFQTSPDTLWLSMGLSGLKIFKLLMTSTGLLASTDQGLFQYDGINWTGYFNSGLPGGLANDLALDLRGTLWAASPSSGLGELIADQWTMHTMPGPASNVIGKLAIDSTGAIWMTHDNKGLSRLSGGSWTLFNSSNSDPDGAGPLQGLSDNGMVSISIAPDGKLWTGSFGGGLYEYDLTSWHHWDYTNSPMYGVPGNHSYWAATAVMADPSGNIWVSGFGSDNLLLMGVFAPYSQDSTWQLFFGNLIGLSTNYVQSFKSQGNDIWVGRGDGLDRLDTKGNPFAPANQVWRAKISNISVSDMEFDPSGTLWLASASGLYFMATGADTIGKLELPPPISGSVNAVASDGVGNIWVGTVAGLGMLKPNREEPRSSIWQDTLTTANSPILGNIVNDIAFDIPTGIVYIGTTTGLSVFNSGILPPTPDLADMKAFPNPIIWVNDDTKVQFKRIPSIGTLSIYSSSGDLVRQLDLSQLNTWDLKNSNGERVAGGIYFFHVISGSASGTGKIAIIK
jgi:ligand-binding sensor domain-containing protein